MEALDPVLALLVDRYYLRPVQGDGVPGRGHASPRYEVNPTALAAFTEEAPRSHCTQRTHSAPEPAQSEGSENSEDSENAPATSEPEANGYTAPGYDPAGNPFDDEAVI